MNNNLYGQPREKNIWLDYIVESGKFDSYIRNLRAGGSGGLAEGVLIMKLLDTRAKTDSEDIKAICAQRAAIIYNNAQPKRIHSILAQLPLADRCTIRDSLLAEHTTDEIRKLQLDESILRSAILGEKNIPEEYFGSLLVSAVDTILGKCPNWKERSHDEMKTLRDIVMLVGQCLVLEQRVQECMNMLEATNTVLQDAKLLSFIDYLGNLDTNGSSRPAEEPAEEDEAVTPMEIEEEANSVRVLIPKKPLVPLDRVNTSFASDQELRFIRGLGLKKDREMYIAKVGEEKLQQVLSSFKKCLGDCIRIHEEYMAMKREMKNEYFHSLSAALSELSQIAGGKDGIVEMAEICRIYNAGVTNFIETRRITSALHSYFTSFIDFEQTGKKKREKNDVALNIAILYTIFIIERDIGGSKSSTEIEINDWMYSAALMEHYGYLYLAIALMAMSVAIGTRFFTQDLPMYFNDTRAVHFFFKRLSDYLYMTKESYFHTASIVCMQFSGPDDHFELVKRVNEVSNIKLQFKVAWLRCLTIQFNFKNTEKITPLDERLFKYFCTHPLLELAVGNQLSVHRGDKKKEEELTKLMGNPENNASNPAEVMERVEKRARYRFLEDIFNRIFE